jgi:hypothetical protein
MKPAARRLAKIHRSEIIARDCQSFRHKNLPDHFRSEENHESERLRRAVESKVNTAGISFMVRVIHRNTK